MKEEKRRIPKVVTFFLLIIAICITYAIVNPIIQKTLTSDDSDIESNYQIKKQKCNLLKEISANCIIEGEGIELKKISNIILTEDDGYVNEESISYRIYNKGENIILYYVINEPLRRDNNYYATITLSKDLKILEEDYSIQFEEDFETYKQQIKNIDKTFVIAFSAFISIVILLMLKILLELILEIIDIFRK